jgi:hypothetical protein
MVPALLAVIENGNFEGRKMAIEELTRMAQIADMAIKQKSEYPFEEGDDYYTIENGEVVWSCWDDVSEEMHTPDTKYFHTEEEAKNYLAEFK